MGTNYYAVRNRPSVSEPYHIGKSSAGWLFNFQTQNEKWNDPPVIWNTFPQVRDWLREHTVETQEFVIMDEYDEIIPDDDFIRLVEDKQHDEHCLSNTDNFVYARNVDGYRFSDGEFC